MKQNVLLIGFAFLASGLSSAQNTSEFSSLSSPFGTDPFDTLQVKAGSGATAISHTDGVGAFLSSSETRVTVSIQDLEHQIPQEAMKEYNKGRKACNKGHLATAALHLRNATALDPGFADAHNDLGVLLARMGNRPEATQEFQETLALAPDHSVAAANLSLSLYSLARYKEVVPLARQALKSDPTLLAVRYVLAMSLWAEKGDVSEILLNFELCADAFPEAHLAECKLLIRNGRPDEAAGQLEAYLHAVPNMAPNRHEVEAQLAELHH